MKSAISLYAEHDRTEQAETGQAEEVRKVMPSGALAKFKAAANTVKVDITAAKALSGGRYAEYNIDQKALLSKARQDEERLAELRKAQKEREEAEEARIDLAKILTPAWSLREDVDQKCTEGQNLEDHERLDMELISDSKMVLKNPSLKIYLEKSIKNIDRSVGTTLSHE
eukprot:UC4_evm1s530